MVEPHNVLETAMSDHDRIAALEAASIEQSGLIAELSQMLQELFMVEIVEVECETVH